MALISSCLRLWGVLLTSEILSLLNESFTLVVSVDLILGSGELLILKWLELYLFEDVVHQLFSLKSFSTRIFLLSTRSWFKKQFMLGKKVWLSNPLSFSCKSLDDKSDILFMLGENLESSSLSYDEILLLFDTWRSPNCLFLIEIC